MHNASRLRSWAPVQGLVPWSSWRRHRPCSRQDTDRRIRCCTGDGAGRGSRCPLVIQAVANLLRTAEGAGAVLGRATFPGRARCSARCRGRRCRRGGRRGRGRLDIADLVCARERIAKYTVGTGDRSGDSTSGPGAVQAIAHRLGTAEVAHGVFNRTTCPACRHGCFRHHDLGVTRRTGGVSALHHGVGAAAATCGEQDGCACGRQGSHRKTMKC